MKIKSNKYKNVTLKLLKEKVSFDKHGEAEVNDKIGLEIMKEYGSMLNPDVKEIVKEEKPSNDSKVVEELNQKNNILEQKVKDLENKLSISESSVDAWKDEFEKLKALPKDSDELTVKEKLTNQDVELIIGLTQKKVDQLEDVAKALQLPETEWSDLKKEDLIIYLSLKAINANT